MGSRPQSPSSTASAGQIANPHAPINPSGLRVSQTLSVSPEDRRTEHAEAGSAGASPIGNSDGVEDGAVPSTLSLSGRAASHEAANAPSSQSKHAEGNGEGSMMAKVKASAREVAGETTSLLLRPFEYVASHAHPGPCDHGTFSPQPNSRAASIKGSEGAGRPAYGRSRSLFNSMTDGIADGFRGTVGKKMTTTARLAEEHGINTSKAMYALSSSKSLIVLTMLMTLCNRYFTYYIPFFAWIRQYKWAYVKGDLVAAITMASLYIPMSLSYAANLGHVPPINGLYSFVFNPLIYAFLGSCPQMVVGPEAAGSLLLGSVVRDSIEKGHTGDEDQVLQAQVAGLVTGIAGSVIFIAGLTRLGFLDSVLSRPFMRGFISSVGVIIIIDQLLTELGLVNAGIEAGVSHGSSVDKLVFIFTHIKEAHLLTSLVAGVSFLVIMICRQLKNRLQPHYPSVAYIPDRFLVVVLSAVFAKQFRWDQQGLEILGEVKSASGGLIPFNWPFQTKHITHIRQAMGTSFLIALLGFFESSVAAKALGDSSKDGIQGVQLSPNRELVALGVANLVGGCFMALPAFGGYGRSKLNASTGGKTPMSSIFLSLITIVCIIFLLPSFHYLPKAVLSSMITVVAWSLIEEAPHDISFFVRIGGYTELGLMAIIFSATIFYSLSLGIAIGVGLSLLSVIRHSTRPRIQILGRIPGTNRFENAEDNPKTLEFIEGCLIVKIPEPLTFANTGDLKNRLRRLELYGTNAAHPALPRIRPDGHNRNIIFDIHGVTGLDGSGTQVLSEIVSGYCERGVRVFFSRGPGEGSHIWDLFVRSGIVDKVGGASHFVADVESALRLTEVEELGENVYENLAGD
jgi:high affinity sulfate transporter 1